MLEFIPRDVTALVRTNVILGLAVAVVGIWMFIAAAMDAVQHLRHHHG